MNTNIVEFCIYESSNGKCPYLDNREWINHFFYAFEFESAAYEELLNKGWRRLGNTFYLNRCEGCKHCLPIRINVNHFSPSKSQRKILRKNKDITVNITQSNFNKEDFELYKKYSLDWHQSDNIPSLEEYLYFIQSPINTQIMRYHYKEKLIGIGWLDFLPKSLSSVYFAFDPDFSDRNLGTFSLLKEIELCKSLNKHWHHLGFYVQECKKMSYKANFKPNQLLIDEHWLDFKIQ